MARTVSRKTRNSMRKDRTVAEKYLNKLKAWAKGKRTMVTIPNPNPNERNKRFIKVEGNHSAAFGPWKKEVRDSKDNKSND